MAEDEFGQFVQALKESFESIGYVVNELKIPGDEFRLSLTLPPNTKPSIEVYHLKGSHFMMFGSVIKLGKNNLLRLKDFTTSQRDALKNDLENIPEQSKLNEYIIDPYESDYGITLRCSIDVDQWDPDKIAPCLNNLNEVGREVEKVLNRHFPNID